MNSLRYFRSSSSLTWAIYYTSWKLVSLPHASPSLLSFFHTHTMGIYTSVSYVKYSLYSNAFTTFVPSSIYYSSLNSISLCGAFFTKFSSFLLCYSSICLFTSQCTCASNWFIGLQSPQSGNMWEMQNLKLYPDLLNCNLYFKGIPRWFLCM